MSSSRAGKKSTIIRILPGLIISVIAIGIVIRLTNLSDLLKDILKFKPYMLLLVAIFTLVYLGFRAMAWRILLDYQVTARDTFWALNIGSLLNNLFPFRAGEFGRAIYLGQSKGIGTMRVLSTIIIERTFDLGFAALAILATLPLALGMDWIKPVANTTLILVIAGTFTLFLMARYSEKVQGYANKIGERRTIFKKFIYPQIDSLLLGLKALNNFKQFVSSLVWIGGSWFLAFCIYFLMLRGLKPEAPFWWGVFADAVLALGIAVPSAPAALGVFEASLVGGLSLLGISYSSALAYAIVMHFMQFSITGILGFYAISRDGQSISKLFSLTQFRKINSETGGESK